MMSANNDPMMSQERPKTKVHKKWRVLDDDYLKKWLIKPAPLIEYETKAEASTQT